MKIQATNKNDEVSDLEEETGGFSDNFVSFVSSDELKEIILQQVGDCPGIESTRIYHSLSNMASQSVFDSFLRELVVDGILIEHQKFEKHQGRFRQNPGYFLSKQHLDSKLHFKLIDNFQYSKLIQQHTIPLEKFTTKTPIVNISNSGKII
ncbi:MAG: hypothetical protein HWD59_03980 [Coxiellaceae bacterium]|nr:MAG: hypothetical protein HWD59_03980 [Coxiellaceae bacterium]